MLPRVFFQVALGILGFFSTPCYSAQQRLNGRGEDPPHWEGGPRLQGHQTASPNPDRARAPETLEAARDRGDGTTSATGGGRNFQKDQQRAESGAAGAASASRETGTGARLGGLPDASLSSLFDPMKASISEDLSPVSRPAGPPAGGNAAASFLRAFTGEDTGKETEGTSTSAFTDNPVLAELLRQSPFGGRGSFQSPRLKRTVETQEGHLSSSGITMCGRRDQDEDVRTTVSLILYYFLIWSS